MKKITKKQAMSAFDNIICVPYCELQFLFPDWERDFYTSGIYGWNADVHMVDLKTCIVTGYRPFGNIEPGSLICDTYNAAAEYNPENRKNLQKEFVKRVLQECVRKN